MYLKDIQYKQEKRMRAKATEIFERKGRQVAKLDGLALNKRNKAICRE